MIFNTKEIIKPFWAEGGSFLGGRDPLGIQNSSIVVYANLLPGMTNLTGRIRYYSFYCWLLAEYHKSERNSADNSIITQYRFIRRAELAMAFLMKNSDVTNIVGRDYVSKPYDGTIFDVAKGADNPKENSYWKYTSGALGQYYAGSLASLGLIEIVDKYFITTEAGRKLATAFIESTSDIDREQFLNLIEVGKIDSTQTNLCESLYIDKIVRDSKEWKLLRDIMFGTAALFAKKREQTRIIFQKAPIADSSVNLFPLWVFRKYEKSIGDLDVEGAEFGWLYYYLNEAIHYSLTTIFWMFLLNINTPHQVDEYIDKVTKAVNNIDFDIAAFDIPQLLDEIKSCVKSSDTYQATYLAIKLIEKIEEYTRLYNDKIDNFENKYSLKQQSGHISDALDTYSKRGVKLEGDNYIRYIIKRVATTHTTVAYRKMGKGDGNLLKYMIEDGVIYRVENVTPQHTTPRLSTLHSFLSDLGYINA